MDNTRITRYHKKKTSKFKKKRKLFLILGALLIVVLFLVWKVIGDLKSTTNNMYVEVEHEIKRTVPLTMKEGQPLSILLLGLDTGELGRTGKGRSDTMMVVTINPETNQTKIVSIPRDTYTEISGLNKMDKINHAYAYGGATMAINTVQDMLNIPIDYFVSVNMESIQQVINAIDGVEINPILSFTWDGYTFEEGVPVTVDGQGALAYARMRKDDPRGDYGRQERQRQVIESVIKKGASLSSILKYQDVLTSLGNNIETNLSFSNMIDIFTFYSEAAANIEQIQLSGTGTTIEGIYYDLVADEELQRVSNLLNNQLELN